MTTFLFCQILSKVDFTYHHDLLNSVKGSFRDFHYFEYDNLSDAGVIKMADTLAVQSHLCIIYFYFKEVASSGRFLLSLEKIFQQKSAGKLLLLSNHYHKPLEILSRQYNIEYHATSVQDQVDEFIKVFITNPQRTENRSDV